MPRGVESGGGGTEHASELFAILIRARVCWGCGPGGVNILVADAGEWVVRQED